jgi:Patatin-like phospholipase
MNNDGPCNESKRASPRSFVEILAEELEEIRRLRPKRGWQDPSKEDEPIQEKGAPSCTPPDDPLHHPDETIAAAHHSDLVGLAFSGGGIRSATFNLGVLQGLADFGLLNRFDYLSTVSGGGYIGSWLAAWISRSPRGIKDVEQGLRPDRKPNPAHEERDEIRFLREYSNYLTPRLGFFGADTWTAIVIYLRNTLLNLTILVFAMAAALLLPRIAVLKTVALNQRWPGFWPHSYWVSILLLAFAVLFTAMNMQLFARPHPPQKPPFYAQQAFIIAFIVVPLLIAAWVCAAWLWYSLPSPGVFRWFWIFWGGVLYGLMWVCFAVVLPPGKSWQPGELRYFRIIAVLSAFGAGLVGGALFWAMARIFAIWQAWPGGIWHVVSFGPPLLILILLAVAAVHIGLMGRAFPDERREWCGRLGAWLMILAIAWAAVFALAIDSPLLVIRIQGWVTGASLLWALSTLAGVLGGKNKKTGGPGLLDWKDIALSFTPYIFVLGAVVALAFGIEFALANTVAPGNSQTFFPAECPASATCDASSLPKGDDVDAAIKAFRSANPTIDKAARWFSLESQKVTFWVYREGEQSGIGVVGPNPLPAGSSIGGIDYKHAHWQLLNFTLNYALLAAFAICVALAFLLAWRVDINEFSMNLLYRNRLVRCYLGASNRGRRPNAFTGFDPADDLFLKDLVADRCYFGPYPILNGALNLVHGKELAWQERKAESFVMTPLHSGFDVWTERRDLEEEDRARDIEMYGFRPTKCFAYPDGGFYVGTAMSISGAAASPNMGYHSLPALSFLLTIFNVRLGFWAGNPRSAKKWQNPGPHYRGIFYLLKELFGATDDNSDYVYLSDGGHFENLGLYELVKRRCKFIIACDAGADGGYGFGDLAGAIRKCREDMGVDIRIATNKIKPHKPESNSGCHCAVGVIDFTNVDLDPRSPEEIKNGVADPRLGILVYLKSSLTGDEPVDVSNYKTDHKDFPHETTADQWFTESQFESYRRLGQHAACSLFDRIWNRDGLPTMAAINRESLPAASNQAVFEALRDAWSGNSGNC